MVRRNLLLVASLLGMAAVLLAPGPSLGQESGEAIFTRICKACHTIGQGKLVGPDLAGVSQRRSRDWIVGFVQSSQSVIKSGDPDAVALFREFNNLIMPDNPLSRAEVLSVIRFIDETSGVPGTDTQDLPTPLDTATAAQLALGEALFVGSARLAGGGPACITCHEVAGRGPMGGGRLSKDLTAVISRMPAPGVQAILSSPPFPVMQQAYLGHPLTDDEIFALTAFFQKLDSDRVAEAPSRHGLGLFFIGVVGAALLMALYAMIWMRRKQEMVYRSIHRRQLKSQ